MEDLYVEHVEHGEKAWLLDRHFKAGQKMEDEPIRDLHIQQRHESGAAIVNHECMPPTSDST